MNIPALLLPTLSSALTYYNNQGARVSMRVGWHPATLLFNQLLLLFLLLLPLREAVTVQLVTFSQVKSDPRPGLILFHSAHASNLDSELSKLTWVAEQLTDLPFLEIFLCDGGDAANSAAFQAAGFVRDFYYFTVTPVEGIVKYTGPVDGASLLALVRSKYAIKRSEDVVVYSNEHQFWGIVDGDNSNRAVLALLVNSREDECALCRRIKPGSFLRTNTFFSFFPLTNYPI
jgi:hypothetical protein